MSMDRRRMVVTARKLRSGATASLLVAMVLLAGCGVVNQEAEPETVLIGVDLGLTGTSSQFDNVYLEALRLRVEQVNQQRLLGNRRLDLRVLDNRSDSATASTNVAELAADPAIAAIVMGASSDSAITSVDAINQAQVPTIALASASAITQPVEERRYLFQIGPTAPDNARLIAGELTGDEVETVALVTTQDEYGEEGRAQMQSADERADFDIVLTETITGEEETAASVASTILGYQPPQDPLAQAEPQEGPDAVVIWATCSVATQLAATLREQGYQGQFYLDSSAADQLFVTGPGGAALDQARMAFTETLVIDGVIATSPAKAARQTWFNDYTSRQGTYHAYSSFAADAVNVLVQAINQAGSTDREALRSEFENLQIDGFSGPIRFRLETHSGLNPLALVMLVAQGDRWRLASD
jgi:branched-chain amino acid transport system substrate-binding protein